TLLDEHFHIKVGLNSTRMIEEMQKDLDEFLEHYNWKRNHLGYRLKGMTSGGKLKEYLQKGGEMARVA
ncbi:MAG: IS481 family transposase, partial [Candidatus Eremiobacteraeota bacterium]|nr:IS481 family transposase [Candidatus Eremiobacteraeota bacterium]